MRWGRAACVVGPPPAQGCRDLRQAMRLPRGQRGDLSAQGDRSSTQVAWARAASITARTPSGVVRVNQAGPSSVSGADLRVARQQSCLRGRGAPRPRGLLGSP